MRIYFVRPKSLWPFLCSFVLPFILCSCLFETEKQLDIPPSLFDLSGLKNIGNPITNYFGIDNNRCVVGLKFAFTSLNYAAEVDTNVKAFQRETGHSPALIGAYFDFTAQPQRLNGFLNAVDFKGAIPYITLDPKEWKGHGYNAFDWKYQKTFLHRINQGEFDSTLLALAEVMKSFSKPILLRWAHEMNGDWYPYAGGGDADGDGKADGPDKYIEAWRHVYTLFSDKGVTNIIWAFCPNAEDFPVVEWNRPFQYYPGDEYVDFILVDAYEHANKKNQSLESAIGYFYNELGWFYRERFAMGDSTLLPLGLGEFGTNQARSEAKAKWYEESLKFIHDDERIKLQTVYNAKNGREDFSFNGLGERIKAGYARVRFWFGV